MTTSEETNARCRAYYAANSERCQETQARYRKANRTKIRARQKKYREENAEKYLARARLRDRVKSGIIDATDELRFGTCPICMAENKKLYCDHDHLTGKKRGWICSMCNLKLGWYELFADKILGYLKGLL